MSSTDSSLKSRKSIPTSLSNVRDEMRSRLSEIDSVVEEWRDDGVLYCKLCGTPRSITLDRLRHSFSYIGVPEGEVIKIRIPCECQIELQRRQEEEEAKQARIVESRKLVEESFLGLRFQRARFYNFKTEGLDPSIAKAKDSASNFCKNNDRCLENGWGIYFYGPCGTGKTELMACMANELMTKHLKTCIFTSFRELSKQIRETFNTRKRTELDIFNRIRKTEFLFIDDIGCEVLRSNGEDTWLQEKVYDIIDARYNSYTPTIFSSNYSIDELEKMRGFSKQVISRIGQMATRVIKLEGEDYRQKLSTSFF